MTDEKKTGPLGPIIRKKKTETPTEEATSAPIAETAAAEATPEPEAAPPAVMASASAAGGNVARQPIRPKKKTSAATTKAMDMDVSVSVDTNASTDDFAALLAESGMGEVKRVRYSVGDLVDATVSAIGDKYVYFDLPGNQEGLANILDFRDDDEALTVAPGDVVEIFVTDLRGGTIQLGRKISSQQGSTEAIEKAFESGLPIEGRVVSRNKGGFDIDINGVRAFCPLSQIELAFTEDPDVHLNKSYAFRVTKFGEDGRNVVVSRSVLQEAERAAAMENLVETLREGMEVNGIVTRLADFGAFVDIGGVDGLIHISELGWSRVAHPSEVVQVGDKVTARVVKLEKHKDDLRIGLSIKEMQPDPWLDQIQNFVEGQSVDGTVVRTEPFGAFVELAPGLEGLVHISEMSWEKHVKRPEDVVRVGDRVTVEIQSVDRARQRISLTMKLSGGDPWSTIEERYALGSEVSGTVANVEDFGAFVELAGVTALIPRSEMELTRGGTPHQAFKKGDPVTARVLSIDKNRRRMALTMKSASEMAEAQETGPSSFTDTSSSSGLGTFGDLLKSRMKGD